MNTEKKSYVAILPDGTEHFRDGYTDRIGDIIQTIVWNTDLRTNRKNPQNITIKLYELKIKNGKLERQLVKTAEVQPLPERMTEKEFSLIRHMTTPSPTRTTDAEYDEDIEQLSPEAKAKTRRQKGSEQHFLRPSSTFSNTKEAITYY